MSQKGALQVLVEDSGIARIFALFRKSRDLRLSLRSGAVSVRGWVLFSIMWSVWEPPGLSGCASGGWIRGWMRRVEAAGRRIRGRLLHDALIAPGV